MLSLSEEIDQLFDSNINSKTKVSRSIGEITCEVVRTNSPIFRDKFLLIDTYPKDQELSYQFRDQQNIDSKSSNVKHLPDTNNQICTDEI
jgi:hypothetical protein